MKHQLNEIYEKKAPPKPTSEGIDVDDWRMVDSDDDRFEVPDPKLDVSFLLLKRYGCNHLDIFFRLYPINLMKKVWEERKNGCWNCGSGGRRINHGVFSERSILTLIAVKLHILALHQTHTSTGSKQRSLRNDIVEALDYFRARNGEEDITGGINPIETFLSSFLLSHEYYDEVSNNFRSFIRSLGEFVSGGP